MINELTRLTIRLYYDWEILTSLINVGAFSGRIGLPPAVMGWATSCDDRP